MRLPTSPDEFDDGEIRGAPRVAVEGEGRLASAARDGRELIEISGANELKPSERRVRLVPRADQHSEFRKQTLENPDSVLRFPFPI